MLQQFSKIPDGFLHACTAARGGGGELSGGSRSAEAPSVAPRRPPKPTSPEQSRSIESEDGGITPAEDQWWRRVASNATLSHEVPTWHRLALSQDIAWTADAPCRHGSLTSAETSTAEGGGSRHAAQDKRG